MFELHIVLHQPEIPQNTGCIARTCVALGVELHLIRPLGFSLEDRYLKRAGMDYWPQVTHHLYDDLDMFLEAHRGGRFLFITKKAQQRYDEADFTGKVFLIFGSESTGIPEDILERNEARCYRIPMRDGIRSLNLANAVSVVAYEAARRSGFPGLRGRS